MVRAPPAWEAVAFVGFLTCVLGFFFSDATVQATLPFYPDAGTAIRYGCLVRAIPSNPPG